MILNLEIFKPNVINILFNIMNNILILILLINIYPYITIRQNVQESNKSIKCNRINTMNMITNYNAIKLKISDTI